MLSWVANDWPMPRPRKQKQQQRIEYVIRVTIIFTYYRNIIIFMLEQQSQSIKCSCMLIYAFVHFFAWFVRCTCTASQFAVCARARSSAITSFCPASGIMWPLLIIIIIRPHMSIAIAYALRLHRSTYMYYYYCEFRHTRCAAARTYICIQYSTAIHIESNAYSQMKISEESTIQYFTFIFSEYVSFRIVCLSYALVSAVAAAADAQLLFSSMLPPEKKRS